MDNVQAIEYRLTAIEEALKELKEVMIKTALQQKDIDSLKNKKIWIIQTFDTLIFNYCLYFSSDKGKTWHKKVQGHDFYHVIFNYNSIFIGNSEGVKKSLDNGVTWITVSNESVGNLFYIDKYLIILPYENKGGIFVSDDDGNSFSFISCGYSYKMMSLAASPTSRIITTDIIGTTSGVKKAVLLVNKNKQFF